MEEHGLYLQLHKLSAIPSEKALDQLLAALWKTRRTGLRSPEKSQFQSLLNLASLGEVDSVLVCLRSLIRKCVREDLTSEGLSKLFPSDLSSDLQTMLLRVLQRYRRQWREENSKEQHLQKPHLSQPIKINVPPTFTTPIQLSEFNTMLRSGNDPLERFTQNDPAIVPSTANATDCQGPAPLRFQSMTWSVENRNAAPTSRVAIVALKLKDFSETPPVEREVKFKLTADTIEPALRSLNYINEKLSSTVRTSSEPVQKKQRQ